MSVKVAEAIGDERGQARGGEPGDQTGNEILIRTFKKRSYAFTSVLRCLDREMAIKAADICTQIALLPQFGYNQDARWTGAKAIEAVGVANMSLAKAGDFDCSSLVLECYKLAGLDIKHTGNTASMIKILKNTGKFEELKDAKYTESTDYALIGDIYDAPNIHALIVLSNGEKADVDPEPEPESDYVSIIRGKVNVRKTPRIPVKEKSNIIYVAHKGDTFPYAGSTLYDATGKPWWAVIYEGRTCYISAANQKHAVLVEV